MPTSPPRQSSKLLIDEQPLIVLPSLAAAIGLAEAVLLQQIHYWCKTAGHARDGRRWIYNSYPEWAAQLQFLSPSGVRRCVNSLRRRGLILIGNYNSSPIDRTQWYAIDYDALDQLPLAAPSNRPPSDDIVTPSAGIVTPSAEVVTPSAEVVTPIPETSTERSSERSPESVRAGAHTLDPFIIDAALSTWWADRLAAAGLPPTAVDVATETAKWTDALAAGTYRRGTGDPAASWRNWMRQALRYAQAHPLPPQETLRHAPAPEHRPGRTRPDPAADAAFAASLDAAIRALSVPGGPGAGADRPARL